MVKRLPSGISDYERLITDNYYYVDKTLYIEKLENYPNPNVMFLRPRKFGKTLFTSTLENYYDVLKKDKFDTLFSDTYIGKNPTSSKNRYYILKFNFAGIDTNSIGSTIESFKQKVILSINSFIEKYNINFFINSDLTSEALLGNIFEAFRFQKPNEKIYVIIDEYDHFANELLGFNVSGFKDLVYKNGKVRKWYEILKEGTESVVDRIFITGVAPITLDGMTSGFNIVSDITRDFEFNEMMGFTKKELIEMMEYQEITSEKIEKLLPVMKENYDGYRFSLDAEEKMYNSNMTLYFLNQYVRSGKVPTELVDVNIASDYAKIGRMLNLCKGEKRLEILETTVSGEGIISGITEKFNPEIGFGDKEMVSMLYYLGYLTIGETVGIYPRLTIPNKMMREIYSDYLLKLVREELKMDFDVGTVYEQMTLETITTGKIDKVIEQLKKYLTNLSNRDYQRFDEKYVKLIFYCITMNMQMYFVRSEMEVRRKYPDLLLIPRENGKGYYSVMIEFKYLKKEEAKKLDEKKLEAKTQIEEYASFDELKNLPNLRKYTVVAVNDEIYIDEV